MIIAEAGVNHNGDLSTAFRLCDEAKNAGADVVKFQTWTTDSIITKEVKKATYQSLNTGKSEPQYDMLKRLELSNDDFCKIKKHCKEIGIVFASTPFDETSLDFLVDLGIPFIKIGSGEICNIPFLRRVGAVGLPVFLSTGMSTIEDIDISIDALRDGGEDDIRLLHCTTNYPCPYDQVNLRAMLNLRDRYGLPVGYSDHTQGIEVALAAVSMGASIIEKHFTIDRNMEGPDHRASMEPKEFEKLVTSIRIIEESLGNWEKRPTYEEMEIKRVVIKRIVAKKNIHKGEVLSADNLTTKRSETGVLAREWDRVVGSIAKKDYKCNKPIEIIDYTAEV